MLRPLAVLAVAAGCVPYAGCSLLSPQSDPSRFYTLSARPQAQRDPMPDGGSDPHGVTYGLGPIRLPAYLDRSEVATRVSATELTYSPTDRWAEPLTDNVTRVLFQDLSSLLDTDRIALYPWWSDGGIDYQVEVEFSRFECDAAGESQLTARWGIKDSRKGRFLTTTESHFTRPGKAGATREAVDGLSDTLGDLSQQIASALRQLPPPQQMSPAPGRKRS